MLERTPLSRGSKQALLVVAAVCVVALTAWKWPVRWVSAQQADQPMHQPATAPKPNPGPLPPEPSRIKLRPTIQSETAEQAQRASVGCMSCHTGIEHANMHADDTVVLGCTDCHGGNSDCEVGEPSGNE